MSDLEYKVGDSDSVAVILDQDGEPIDLTSATVVFVIKSSAGTKVEINCTLGCTYNGTYHASAVGGVTVPLTAINLATAGQYRGEFVITKSGYVGHSPSGNNYLTMTIWDAL